MNKRYVTLKVKNYFNFLEGHMDPHLESFVTKWKVPENQELTDKQLCSVGKKSSSWGKRTSIFFSTIFNTTERKEIYKTIGLENIQRLNESRISGIAEKQGIKLEKIKEELKSVKKVYSEKEITSAIERINKAVELPVKNITSTPELPKNRLELTRLADVKPQHETVTFIADQTMYRNLSVQETSIQKNRAQETEEIQTEPDQKQSQEQLQEPQEEPVETLTFTEPHSIHFHFSHRVCWLHQILIGILS